MSIDFSKKEDREGYLQAKLDDLLDGINASYGQSLLDELMVRLETTIDDFNKAIELKPDYADAYYYRGNSKKELGKLYCSDYDKSCQLGKRMSCEQYKITCRNLEL